MKAARQADTCTLKGVILALAKDHAGQFSFTLDVGLNKDQRGLKDEATACLFLPEEYLDEYCESKEVSSSQFCYHPQT